MIELPARNLQLIVAYQGTHYHGWQFQPGHDTVEGRLRRVLAPMLQHEPGISVAGRTDAGVHALAQSAGFRTDSAIDLHRLQLAANSRLSDDISIRSINEMPMPWHATLSATGKHYRYAVWAESQKPLYHETPFHYHFYRPLNIDLMRQAAETLTGRHDFKSFQSNSGELRESTVRTVRRIDVSADGPRIFFDLFGDGFLYHMVRNIVGTLLEVGRGKRTPDDIPRILAAADRRAAGGTAPALGLTLMRVYYGDQPWTIDAADRQQEAAPE